MRSIRFQRAHLKYTDIVFPIGLPVDLVRLHLPNKNLQNGIPYHRCLLLLIFFLFSLNKEFCLVHWGFQGGFQKGQQFNNICFFRGFSSHSGILYSYENVTITGDELQKNFFTYTPLSSEGSLACHTYCDTGQPFINNGQFYLDIILLINAKHSFGYFNLICK